MGNYLNPGNSGFALMRNSVYVDKSGIIDLVNKTINTTEQLTCVSRPRRFGKSFAAKMLCAYYDRSCDSSALFADLAIANNPKYVDSYRKHLNRYDVIYLDMAAVISAVNDKTDIVSFVKRNVTAELMENYPQVNAAEAFYDTLANAVSYTGIKFIMIVDEWDAPIREAKNDAKVQRMYLDFLRYEWETKTAYIPNEEIRLEFAKSVRKVKRDETIRRVRESDQLIMDTVWGNAEAVAAQIEKIHAEETAVLFYNNE